MSMLKKSKNEKSKTPVYIKLKTEQHESNKKKGRILGTPERHTYPAPNTAPFVYLDDYYNNIINCDDKQMYNSIFEISFVPILFKVCIVISLSSKICTSFCGID